MRFATIEKKTVLREIFTVGAKSFAGRHFKAGCRIAGKRASSLAAESWGVAQKKKRKRLRVVLRLQKKMRTGARTTANDLVEDET